MWIDGQVSDKRGRPLSGVAIEAPGTGITAQRREVTSNAGGHYVCDVRPPLDVANVVATINAELRPLEP